MTREDLEVMLSSYIETALWSSTDNSDDSGGKPLDDNYGPDDILKATLRGMRADCKAFGKANSADIGDNWARAGRDFWLTRNGHGAGFWDGDWPEDVGQRMTDSAHAFGQINLYVYRGKVRAD